MKIIEVKKLKKSYGDVQAVRGIDFYVEEGSLFAFLGENGAGKSTTIDIICTLLKPDSGVIYVNGSRVGKEDHKIRKDIGVVFQDNTLDPLLTVKENLKIRGGFYSLSSNELEHKIHEAAKAAEIESILKRSYGKLSGGQRRRVDIARALINTPKILFLDEPTTGLDPSTRKSVWQTIRKLQKERNMTVFLTTHYMEEAAKADYITVMGKGRILAKGTPIELKHSFCTDLLKIKPAEPQPFEDTLKSFELSYRIKGETYHIPLNNTTDAIPIVETFKGKIDNLEIINGTMDEVFLNIIKQSNKDSLRAC